MDIGPLEKQRIQEILHYAIQPEHWYKGESVMPDLEKHTLTLASNNVCIFTYSVTDTLFCRHLTMFKLTRELPDPFMARVLAREFGFTGWTGDADMWSKWFVTILKYHVEFVQLCQMPT